MLGHAGVGIVSLRGMKLLMSLCIVSVQGVDIGDIKSPG